VSHGLKDQRASCSVFSETNLCYIRSDEACGWKLGFDSADLVAYVTDGAPATCERNVGSFPLLEKFRQITKPYCIIHLQVLSSSVVKSGCIVSLAVSIVTHLLFRGLKHRTFRASLEEVDGEGLNLPYGCEVVESTKNGPTYRCSEEGGSKLLLEIEPVKLQELKSKSSNQGLLFFLYGITANLNGLGIQLQGKGKLVFQLFAAVKAFRMILKLYTSKLSKLEICNFPSFAHRIPQRRHARLREE
jgi:hypothetical protein